VIGIAIPLAVGGLSALITRKDMGIYNMINTPTFAPPPILFPIVWTILYVLMGISAARVFMAPPTATRNYALIVYFAQLIVNFFWSIIFFNLEAYGFAFFWLLLLWVLIITTIYLFSKIDKLSALLQIPYIIWVTFAGYLNLMIWLLNK
jgi:tryptophan-rich sensory protein